MNRFSEYFHLHIKEKDVNCNDKRHVLSIRSSENFYDAIKMVTTPGEYLFIYN